MALLQLYIYGLMQLDLKKEHIIQRTVLATLNQVKLLLHLSAMTTTVSQDHLIIPLAVHSPGLLVIHCGTVLDVEDKKVLAAIVLDCLGLKRAYQFLPLPVLVCVSVVIQAAMKILVFNILNFTSIL